jgi:selenocysteine lyase/cysteine desulfurase
VLGTALDVPRLARRANAAGVLVLVDAAQTAGHLPISFRDVDVDMVAFTGHKGLLGPQGVGALWVRDGVEVQPFLRGGTGGDSRLREMPSPMPDRLEAGTQNAPGIAGLGAGIEWLRERGVEHLHQHSARLRRTLHEGLAAIDGIEVLSPREAAAAIVSIRADRMDAGELAKELDLRFGVLARPGLHCAPDAHAVLGTTETGALRFSLGWASSEADVDRAVSAVGEIVGVGRVFAVVDRFHETSRPETDGTMRPDNGTVAT